VAKNQTRLLLSVAALGAFIMVASTIALVLLMQSDLPSLDGKPRWLKARIAGQLAEAPGNEALLVDPLDLPPLTSELTASLREAATDDSIRGVYLEVGPIGGGWAAVQEIRDALLVVRDAGKPCVVWADTLTTKEYVLASPCTIHLAPAGLVFVEGLSTTRMYYAETFERYGVSANFAHVGDFKSAVEPYERTGPSEAAQAANDALLDSIYAQMIATIADGRGVEPSVAEGWLNDPPMTPGGALAAGMVDHLSYADEARHSLLALQADDSGEEEDGTTATEDATTTDTTEEADKEPEFKALSDYLRTRRQEWKQGSDKVAVIYAEGTIVSGKSNQDMFGSSYIGDRTVVAQLKKVREDDSVKAVVLRVNSPGGSGSASDAMWREIVRTRDAKPLIVSQGDYAASGGYYMSMAADRIFASPGTITGSIGVFGGKMNLAGVYESFGVHLHTDQRGRYASMLSSTKDFDEAERAKFQSFLGGFYEIFTTKAAEGRGMTVEDIHAVAQGRVWTGEQALGHGLIDELGGLDAAVAYAATAAELDSYALVRYPERRSFMDQLIEELTDPNPGADARLAEALAPMRGLGGTESIAGLVRLRRVLADGGAAMLLPGDRTLGSPRSLAPAAHAP
jgi:protease-4